MNPLRPQVCRNFLEDFCKEEKTPYLLRENANPNPISPENKCYEDGLAEKILENIEVIGHNLKSHENMNRDRLKKIILKYSMKNIKSIKNYLKM